MQIQQSLHSLGRSQNHSLPLAIACYLVQLGCDPEVRNRKNKTCADIIADTTVWETIVSYVGRRNETFGFTNQQSTVAGESTLITPLESKGIKVPTSASSNTDSPDDVNGVECVVCSENAPNVRFSPCGHAITCRACASRMKKCLECHTFILSKDNLGSYFQI